MRVRDQGTPADAFCRAVVKEHAHSFFFASRFLSLDKRRDVFALYALYRTMDDLVDERSPSVSPASVLEELNRWRVWLCDRIGAPGSPLLRDALTPVLDIYNIPSGYFEQMIDGLAEDLYPRQLASFAELETYCYRVAGTVGIVLSLILGASGAAALDSARSLGIAMQLTNVLRDIGEDLDRGIVFLPADELRSFNYSADRLRLRCADADFVALMRAQALRARTYYRKGVAGVACLPHEYQLPIVFAARIYEGVLAKIEAHRYDVFRQRLGTRPSEKLWIAGKSYIRHRTRQSWAGYQLKRGAIASRR